MTILAFAGSLTRPAPNFANARGEGITSFAFDPQTGDFAELGLYPGVDDATWLVASSKTQCLYALCEVDGTDQSWVIAFGFESDGRLTEKNRHPTGGQTACHASLTPDGRYLIVANYNADVPAGAPDAAVCVFPIAPEGSLGQPSDHVFHQGRGPNADRQTRSHAHCAVVSSDGQCVYVADLGVDRVFVYRLGADGKLRPQPEADLIAPSGAGPRHIAMSADGQRLFMISELEPMVFSAHIVPKTGVLELVSTVALAGSDVRPQPSGLLYDEATSRLYAGLRSTDEIARLKVDPANGHLDLELSWPCGGMTPRDLAFAPGGAFLVVANQDADRLTTFRVGPERQFKPQHIAVKTPMVVAFATLKD